MLTNDLRRSVAGQLTTVGSDAKTAVIQVNAEAQSVVLRMHIDATDALATVQQLDAKNFSMDVSSVRGVLQTSGVSIVDHIGCGPQLVRLHLSCILYLTMSLHTLPYDVTVLYLTMSPHVLLSLSRQSTLSWGSCTQ